MNILSKVFNLRKRYSKRMVVSIITLRFINLVSFFDLYEPVKISQIYKDCLIKINSFVTGYGGHIGELIGNFILIFYLEEENNDHAEKACKAALYVRRYINEVNAKNSREGIQPFKIAIGIHTGEVLVSNELARRNDEIKIIGENVNVATRVMEKCTIDGNEILVSEKTVNMIDDKRFFVKKDHLDIDLPNLFPNMNQLIIYGIKSHELDK